jgi:hypothetical protein
MRALVDDEVIGGRYRQRGIPRRPEPSGVAIGIDIDALSGVQGGPQVVRG